MAASMGGWIKDTKNKKEKDRIWKKEKEKSRRAKKCFSCNQNNDGWCLTYKKWCNLASKNCAKQNNKKKR